jgi:hypothetical protein
MPPAPQVAGAMHVQVDEPSLSEEASPPMPALSPAALSSDATASCASLAA